MKPHNSTLLQFLFLFSIATATATAGSRPTTLHHRTLPPRCNRFFGFCNNQWPFSPISNSNYNNHPYTPRPFLRRQIPPIVLPPPADSNPSLSPLVASPPPPRYTLPPPSDSDPSFSPLVASPPPPRYTLPPPSDSDPSFSPLVASPPPPRRRPRYTLPPPSDSDPSFSPLVASPPPPRRRPRYTLPPAVPQLPPLAAVSFSPPAADDLPPEVDLPPPVNDNMQPEPFNVPAPPLVPIASRPQGITMPPAVDGSATTEPRLPAAAESPPAI